MNRRTAGRIDLPDDPAFTRKSWIVERAGWVGVTLFLLASIGGLLGRGLFSETSADDRAGVRVVYDRFGHYHSESTLRVRLDAHGESESPFWIDDAYLNDVEIQSIRPAPASVRAESGGSSYRFAMGNGEGPVEVRFELQYRRAGTLRGQVGRSRERAVEIRHFIYP